MRNLIGLSHNLSKQLHGSEYNTVSLFWVNKDFVSIIVDLRSLQAVLQRLGGGVVLSTSAGVLKADRFQIKGRHVKTRTCLHSRVCVPLSGYSQVKSQLHSCISRHLEILRSREVWLLEQIDLVEQLKGETLHQQLQQLHLVS